MNKISRPDGVYQIRIRERLDYSLSDWMEDITVTPQGDDGTLLVGWFPDQSALRGLLDQLWNLNMTILSLEQIDNRYKQEPVPERRKK